MKHWIIWRKETAFNDLMILDADFEILMRKGDSLKRLKACNWSYQRLFYDSLALIRDFLCGRVDIFNWFKCNIAFLCLGHITFTHFTLTNGLMIADWIIFNLNFNHIPLSRLLRLLTFHRFIFNYRIHAPFSRLLLRLFLEYFRLFCGRLRKRLCVSGNI